jgi:prepilin-type N-terminal cleavage/methylation domain-containing protein
VIRPEQITSRMRRLRSEERGFTLPELSVSMAVGSIILIGLFMLINISVRSSARTTNRVAVDQIVRPAMQRIVDAMHSACIYPGLAPVQPGSNDTSMSIITGSGDAANPTPALHAFSLDSQGKLVDAYYPLVSGTAPNWSFAAAPTNIFTMAPRAFKITSTTPVFRYYKYVGGAISSTPLPASTGLTADNAKLVVQVTVAFKVSSTSNADAIDSQSGASLTESVLLRFSPSNEDTNKAGLPCT